MNASTAGQTASTELPLYLKACAPVIGAVIRAALRCGSLQQNGYSVAECLSTTEEYTVPGKFELYKDKGGKFRFRLKASNGQIILTSQAYKTKPSAKNGIASVQKNAGNDARFERKSSKDKFMFNLKAMNGQVVGTSERYDSERACENGVKSVGKQAVGAKIEDQTLA